MPSISRAVCRCTSWPRPDVPLVVDSRRAPGAARACSWRRPYGGAACWSARKSALATDGMRAVNSSSDETAAMSAPCARHSSR